MASSSTQASRLRSRVALAASIAAASVALGTTAAHATAPTKLLPETQFGAKVNSNGANFCTTVECEAAGGQAVSGAGAVPGGFAANVRGVATGPGGDIYVADLVNQRVQILKPNGEFVLMFGKKVNETTGGNICTETEIVGAVKAKCKAGESTAEAGGFKFPASVAVDPVSGNVYVDEFAGNWRVDEYTSEGQFVLMIGKKVNKNGASSHPNLCVASESLECGAGEKAPAGSTEQGAFNFTATGNELAAGGPKGLLYVGDEHRVQEFTADGTAAGEIRAPLEEISSAAGSKVHSLALDQGSGELYVVYYPEVEPKELKKTIYRIDATKASQVVAVPARQSNEAVTIQGMALDTSPAGLLAITEKEGTIPSGALLDDTSGKQITEFTLLAPGASKEVPSLAFDSTGGMYGSSPQRNEVVGYVPRSVAELITGPISCTQEAEVDTLVTLECTLSGQVNPEGVAETKAWFEWGATQSLGEVTAEQLVCTASCGESLLAMTPVRLGGILPNRKIYEQMAAFDEYVKEGQESPITDEETSESTPVVPPRVVGAPSAAFVKPTSAVFSGEIDPENADTEYSFEYGPGEALPECPLGGAMAKAGCPSVATTTTLASSFYAKIGVMLEANGLQPDTVYRYRLTARNYKGQIAVNDKGGAQIPEGEFRTAPAPVVRAITGPAAFVTATSAVITGSVDPDGQPAVYTFERGVDDGPSTQYAAVFSGSAGEAGGLTPEEFGLTGLQPNTTYAYRIKIESAYGSAVGATGTFTTLELPVGLAPPPLLAQLPTPNVAFPGTVAFPGAHKAPSPRKCARGLRRKKHMHCAKAKSRKAVKRKRGRSRRKG